MSFFEEDDSPVALAEKFNSGPTCPPEIEQALIEALLGTIEEVDAHLASGVPTTEEEKARHIMTREAAYMELQGLYTEAGHTDKAQDIAKRRFDQAHSDWSAAAKGSKEGKEALARKQAARKDLVASGAVAGEKAKVAMPDEWGPEFGEPSTVHFQLCIKEGECLGFTVVEAQTMWGPAASLRGMTWDSLGDFISLLWKRNKKGFEVPNPLPRRPAFLVNQPPNIKPVDAPSAPPQEERTFVNSDTGEVLDKDSVFQYYGREPGFAITDLESLKWYARKKMLLEKELEVVMGQYQREIKALQSDLNQLEFLFGAQAEHYAFENLPEGKKTLHTPYGSFKFRAMQPSWSIGNEEQLQTWLNFLKDKEKEHYGVKPKTWTRDLDKLKGYAELQRKEGNLDAVPGLKWTPAHESFSISLPEDGENV